MCGPGQGLFLGFFRDSSEFAKGLLRGFFKCSLSVPGKLGFLSFRWDFGVRAFSGIGSWNLLCGRSRQGASRDIPEKTNPKPLNPDPSTLKSLNSKPKALNLRKSIQAALSPARETD